MSEIKCYRIFESKDKRGFGKGILTKMDEQDLTPGDVLIEAHYSGINYKDALAALGEGRILKKYPLNGGIDVSGVVLESKNARFKEGDEVLVNGSELSEFTDGGFAEKVRVNSDFVIPLPKGLSLKSAMVMGTAGFTAALCVHRMLVNGQKREMGPILVTGATGGVGVFAIQIFSKLGFRVHALSGKKDQVSWLKEMGAAEVSTFEELALGDRPLESARFGGCVDNLGGEVLAKILPHIQLWGNVASVGLALDFKLNTTVMPFILRGVSLLGASSNNCEPDLRREIWKKLGGDWNPPNLEGILKNEVSLEDLNSTFQSFLERKHVGRTIVKIKG